MPRSRSLELVRFLVVPIVGAAAFALNALLHRWLGDGTPVMISVLGVAVASTVGGLGPGLVTTAICVVILLLDLDPPGTATLSQPLDHVRIVLFVLFGASSAMLGERRRASLAEAERTREALAREREARADAERSARLRDEFLATVSHELRTPLNAIVGWAELLGVHAPPETLAKGLGVIRRNARAQTALIEDLLDASSLAEGKLPLAVQQVGLYDVVRDAIETVRHAANARQIDLLAELEPAVVCGDARRLHQVVWNLLSNAVKFGRPGGEVRVRVGREGRNAIIAVTDDGRGIDPAFLPKVFEKFRQEDAAITRKYGGLGLGLAITRSIVELHGGTITAESPGLGAGSTFTVRIPLAAAQDAAGVRTVGARAVRAGRLDGACVLVVDDDDDALETAALALERAGAQVLRAHSGDEALAGIASRPVAAVVLDLMMPGRDGFEVLDAMRARGSDAPVIALTALAFPSDHERTRRAGFAAHVTKPVEPRKLIDAVATSMEAVA